MVQRTTRFHDDIDGSAEIAGLDIDRLENEGWTITDVFCRLQVEQRWPVSYRSLLTPNISSPHKRNFLCFDSNVKLLTAQLWHWRTNSLGWTLWQWTLMDWTWRAGQWRTHFARYKLSNVGLKVKGASKKFKYFDSNMKLLTVQLLLCCLKLLV